VLFCWRILAFFLQLTTIFQPFFTKKRGSLGLHISAFETIREKKVEAFAEKFRDPRIANMLKVRAKTLIEYKEVGSYHHAGPLQKAGSSYCINETGGFIFVEADIFLGCLLLPAKKYG